jgi:RHS repeat-associated protein
VTVPGEPIVRDGSVSNRAKASVYHFPEPAYQVYTVGSGAAQPLGELAESPLCAGGTARPRPLARSGGNAVLTIGTTKNPFRYVGQIGYYYDIDVVRYWLRARYLSQSQGQFLSRDPIGFAITDVNLYRYASNKPINATDPSDQQIVESGAAVGCATVVWPTGATIVVVGGGVEVAGGVAGCLLYQTVTQPLLEPTLTEWISDWYLANKCRHVCTTNSRNWDVGTPYYGRIFESAGSDLETTKQAAWQACFDAGCHTPGRGGDCGHSGCHQAS